MMMAIALLMAIQFAGSTKPTPITVFVTPPIREGFVAATKEIADSVKDVQNALKKHYRIVSGASTADVVITIRARTSGSGGSAVAPIGGVIVALPIDRVTLHGFVEAGSFHQDMSSDGRSESWNGAAKSLAKNVRAWIEANAATIRAKRQP